MTNPIRDAQALLATLSKATPGEWDGGTIRFRLAMETAASNFAAQTLILVVNGEDGLTKSIIAMFPTNQKTKPDAQDIANMRAIVAMRNDAPKIINALIERIAELEAQVRGKEVGN